MKLSISERYTLLDLLPKEGTYTTLKILNKLRETLSFTEDELKRWDIRETLVPTGGYTVQWLPNVDSNVDVPISEKSAEIIMTALSKLNDNGKLTNRELVLYEKFVLNKE